MPPPAPTADGQLTPFNLSGSAAAVPRVFYVNGIQTDGIGHARTAAYLSLLLERPVWGVFNATAGIGLGIVGDLIQCLADFTQNATARPFSSGNKPGRVKEADVPRFLATLEKNYVVWNKATLSLFRELVIHRHTRKLIVAHSQGNLVTSNALFVFEDALGSAALHNVRVYSLASPSPAWPVGLRHTEGGGGRQDNAFMNDLVSLLRPHNLAAKLGDGRFQNAGDFRTMPGAGAVGLAPHDVGAIIAALNFLKSIRGDLGLPKELSPEFLKASNERAEAAYPRR